MQAVDAGEPVDATCTRSSRILLVEHEEVTRRGLSEMLRSLCDDEPVRSVRSVRSASEAIIAFEEHCPEVVIVAADLPGMAKQGLLSALDSALIVVLLRQAELAGVAHDLRTRASAFLVGNVLTLDVLTQTLGKLSRGEVLISVDVARNVLSDRPTHAEYAAPHLTPRERTVLFLLAQGMSNKQIARELAVTIHGAKRHIANVMMKFNCPSRTMVVARALKEGLLDTIALEERMPT